MASVEDLDRRVLVLGEKMDGLVGGQETILDVLRDHGRLLARHDERLNGIDGKLAGHDGRLDSIDGKLDLVVDWIQSQP